MDIFSDEPGRREGQGSPLSPLLSNILLHELDKFLEAKGQKFVRYADDFSIYTKSKSKARSIGNQVYLFLKDKLKLPINRDRALRILPVEEFSKEPASGVGAVYGIPQTSKF